MKKDVLIIIPAYNEEESIGRTIESITSADATAFADILVVNDASTDNTAKVVSSLGIKMCSNLFNLGYGSSVQLGYKYAYRYGYDYVIQLDGDGQHDASNIRPIYERLLLEEDGKKPDIVIGSRFLPGGLSFSIPAMKMLAIRYFRWLIKAFTGKVITDPTSGLQGLNRTAFSAYSGFNGFDTKYPDANMIIQMVLRRYHIVEIPAVMHDRIAGVSMHRGFKSVFYMLLMTLSIIIVFLRDRKQPDIKGTI